MLGAEAPAAWRHAYRAGGFLTSASACGIIGGQWQYGRVSVLCSTGYLALSVTGEGGVIDGVWRLSGVLAATTIPAVQRPGALSCLPNKEEMGTLPFASGLIAHATRPIGAWPS